MATSWRARARSRTSKEMWIVGVEARTRARAYARPLARSLVRSLARALASGDRKSARRHALELSRSQATCADAQTSCNTSKRAAAARARLLNGQPRPSTSDVFA